MQRENDGNLYLIDFQSNNPTAQIPKNIINTLPSVLNTFTDIKVEDI